MKYFKTKYGYFDEKGDYVITDPKTPMPWVNILTNGRYGSVYSQSGSGYAFYIDASQSLLTRWVQDLVKDDYGKYIYIRNDDTGEIYSPTFQPVQHKGKYKITFSPGLVKFDTKFSKFDVEMRVAIPLDDDGEIINLSFKNKSKNTLHFSIFSYFELNMGTNADFHHEFHKLFFETKFIKTHSAILSKKYLWLNWNDSYPYVLVHSTSGKVVSFDTDKRSFIGMYGDVQKPQAVKNGICDMNQDRHIDGINALHVKVELKPETTKELNFFIGVGQNEEEALSLAKKYNKVNFDNVKKMVKAHWGNFLGKFKVSVPNKDIEFLINKWLPYQAIGGRLMARTAYYQMGGAYGFRDQLQDSLAALWLNPKITKDQIKLHAAHQRQDGTVQHWWLPLTNWHPSERWSDDLLWLPFAIAEYIEHTGDKSILKEKVPFLDGEEGTIKDHAIRSIKSVLSNRSQRGIPFIFNGDWNDGLNGLGREGKGESFWVSEFLYYILSKVQETFKLGKTEKDSITKSTKEIKDSFNSYAWNGNWFDRATSDDGLVLGGKNDERIFLNAQNWAVLSEISGEDKLQKAMENVKKRLITDYGPLLFTPPFTKPDPKIGYLSRYSPGSRENGGVYTHAAVWTLWSAWKMKDSNLSDKVYESLSPIKRSTKDPDTYMVEPYLTPGNSDGPLSPKSGRAGWTWYSGSAGWFYRAIIEYYIGVKPVKDGILFSPSTNKKWKSAKFTFTVRDGEYTLEIENSKMRSLTEERTILIDGEKIDGDLIPYLKGIHNVKVRYT
ncbi:MAG: glycosyl transferase family 36 [Thermotogae bacterium]|jgi:cellobiose phosphorylase|nr:glycosyl transferase family 36 [Thermotogota bacterium]MCL5032721.1 glycosyl transferase family 36 [Thermotogota bacterium]